jgi:hypothetical protein
MLTVLEELATPRETAGESATPRSLDLPPDLPFEEWQQIGERLCHGQKVINWWIGDWWNSGQHRYGERARLAAEGIFGREFQTLQNIGSVCRAFDTSRRREALSFTHHAEVAALPPVEQEVLLNRAERENLSVKALRAEARPHRDRALVDRISWDMQDPDPD